MGLEGRKDWNEGKREVVRGGRMEDGKGGREAVGHDQRISIDQLSGQRRR